MTNEHHDPEPDVTTCDCGRILGANRECHHCKSEAELRELTQPDPREPFLHLGGGTEEVY